MDKFCVSLHTSNTLDDLGNDIHLIKHYSNLGNVYLITGDMSSLVLNASVDYFMPNELDISYHWGKTRLTTSSLPLPTTFNSHNTGKGTDCYVLDNFESSHGDTMVQAICDISPDTTIHNIHIHGSTVDAILTGLNDIMEHHLLSVHNTKVVNIAWTTLRHPFLENIISGLTQCNLLFVCAAGNSGTQVSLYFPASSDCALTVGCSDEYDRVVPFGDVVCNYGEEIDLFAPGVDVDGHTGTSISCAITSAAALHYIEADTPVSAPALKQQILNSAKQDILYLDRDLYNCSPNVLLQLPS